MESESGCETTTAGGALSSEPRATSDTASPIELASNWPCTACTFLNAPHAALCTMCDSPKVLEAAGTCTQPRLGDVHPSIITPSLGDEGITTEYSDDENGGGSCTEDRPQQATLLASVSALNSNHGSVNGGSSGGTGDWSNSALRPCATCKVAQGRSNFSKTQWYV